MPEAWGQSYRVRSNSRLAVLGDAWDPYNESSLGVPMPGISGPFPPDSGLEKLLLLNCSSCQLIGYLPRVWRGMYKLESLLLGNNSLMGSPLLYGLSALQRLSLDGNRLNGTLHNCTVAACYPNVKQLSISRNALTSTLPPSWSSRLLTHLDVSMNRLSGTLPNEWGGMVEVQGAVVASDLSNSLQSLLLQGNMLAGSIPSGWSAMRSLACWSLAGNSPMCGSVPANMTCPDGNGTAIGKSWPGRDSPYSLSRYILHKQPLHLSSVFSKKLLTQ